MQTEYTSCAQCHEPFHKYHYELNERLRCDKFREITPEYVKPDLIAVSETRVLR